MIISRDQWLDMNDPNGTHFKASWFDPKKVALTFYVKIATTAPIALRNKRLWGLDWHSKKDLDNYIKFILDVGNGILWNDDSQIIEIHAVQKYSETPCTIIEVEAIKMYMTDDADLLTRIFSPLALEKLESDLSLLLSELEGHRLSMISHENTAEHKDAIAKRLKEFSNSYGLALKKMRDGK